MPPHGVARATALIVSLTLVNIVSTLIIYYRFYEHYFILSLPFCLWFSLNICTCEEVQVCSFCLCRARSRVCMRVCAVRDRWPACPPSGKGGISANARACQSPAPRVMAPSSDVPTIWPWHSSWYVTSRVRGAMPHSLRALPGKD